MWQKLGWKNRCCMGTADVPRLFHVLKASPPSDVSHCLLAELTCVWHSEHIYQRCWQKGNSFVPAGSARHMTLRGMIFLSGLQEAEGQKWTSDNGICWTIFMWALCSQIHWDGSELSVPISICQVWIALEEPEPSQVKASGKLIEIMPDMDMTPFWGQIN